MALALWWARAPLPAPPLLHPSDWVAWVGARGPAVTVMGMLRLATLGVACWVFAACVLWMVAEAIGSAMLRSAARRVTPRWLGVLLVATTTASTAAAPAWATGADTIVMRPSSTPVSAPAETSAPAQPPIALPPASRSLPGAASPVEPTVHTVEAGDSLWSIAEEAVRARQPEAPVAAVGRYWLSLLAANRALLPDPGDPNLLYPGDRLVLPPLPGT